MGPFLETLLGGLLTGMLYSLVALGFVLIFKASGVSAATIFPFCRIRTRPQVISTSGRICDEINTV